MNRRRLWLAAICLALVGISIAARLLPHPPNFAPVAAMALFGAFLLNSRVLALLLVTAAMLVSDAAIGFYDLRLQAVVYLSLAGPALLGPMLRARLSALRVGASAACGSACFYAATNFAVWAMTPWYTKDFSGLGACMAAGIPFMKFTLAGDLFWSFAFFGSYAAVMAMSSSRTTSPHTAFAPSCAAT